MEAKDTVLSYLQVSNQIPMTLLEFIAKLEAQAEITWPIAEKAGMRRGVHEITQAILNDTLPKSKEMKDYLESLKQDGRRDGRREVVGWLNNYVPMFCRDDDKWQAQLKKWGIE